MTTAIASICAATQLCGPTATPSVVAPPEPRSLMLHVGLPWRCHPGSTPSRVVTLQIISVLSRFRSAPTTAFAATNAERSGKDQQRVAQDVAIVQVPKVRLPSTLLQGATRTARSWALFGASKAEGSRLFLFGSKLRLQSPHILVASCSAKLFPLPRSPEPGCTRRALHCLLAEHHRSLGMG